MTGVVAEGGEKETIIAQGLRTADDSAGYDAACKRVLSEKVILAQIMNTIR